MKHTIHQYLGRRMAGAISLIVILGLQLRAATVVVNMVNLTFSAQK